MTLDDRQIAALVFLAKGCRPLGAARWDEAGIRAAVVRIRDWSLPEVIAETVTAAADRDVDKPGAIGKLGRRFQAVAPTPPPERLGSHERCSICSHSEPACRMRNGGDHEFLSVERARAQAADEQTRAQLVAQAHAGVTKRPPEPPWSRRARGWRR